MASGYYTGQWRSRPFSNLSRNVFSNSPDLSVLSLMITPTFNSATSSLSMTVFKLCYMLYSPGELFLSDNGKVIVTQAWVFLKASQVILLRIQGCQTLINMLMTPILYLHISMSCFTCWLDLSFLMSPKALKNNISKWDIIISYCPHPNPSNYNYWT